MKHNSDCCSWESKNGETKEEPLLLCCGDHSLRGSYHLADVWCGFAPGNEYAVDEYRAVRVPLAGLRRRYNKRAMEWNTTGLKEFEGMHILAKVPNHQKEMEPITTSTGAFYPVRDSCNRDGDPEEGCVYTPALYYKVDIPYSNTSLPFTLSQGKSSIVEDTLIPVIERKLYVHDLNCDHDTY